MLRRMIGRLVCNELEIMWKWSWLSLRHSSDVFDEGLIKTVKDLNKYNPYLGRDLNQGPIEYGEGLLSTRSDNIFSGCHMF